MQKPDYDHMESWVFFDLKIDGHGYSIREHVNTTRDFLPERSRRESAVSSA